MNTSAFVKLGVLLAVAASCTACSSAEERKANYLKRGQTYYEQQNYDKAKVELRNALQIDPKYTEARFLFARVAERKDDLRAAAGQYLGIIDENPHYAPARAAMARLYLLGGLPDKASELVVAGLKDDPNQSELLMMRGAIAAHSGKLNEALADALASYKKNPKDELTVALLASIYKQMNRVDDAVRVVSTGITEMPRSVDLHIVLADLEGSREHYDVVEAQLKQVIALEPTVLGHRTRLAQFYRFRNQPEQTEGVWRQAVKDLPDEQQPKLALVGYLWSTKGESAATEEMQQLLAKDKDQNLKLEWASFLMRQGKAEQAEKAFHEIIDDAGVKAAGLGARNRLAASYLGRKQPDKASALIAEVLKENPRDNDALIMRANMALAKGDAATAITDLRGVLRDQPNSVPLMRALARAHIQNNELSLAEETLRNALQNNPTDVQAKKDLAQLYIQENKPDKGLAMLDELAATPEGSDDLQVLESQFRSQLVLKDFKAAEQTIAKIKQQHGAIAMPFYLGGVLADARGDINAAKENYELALAKQPDGAEPLAALIRIDVAQKQNQRALQRLDKVIAAYPQHAVAYNLRGELLLSSKQVGAATESFRKAVDLTPKWWAPYRGLAIAQLADKQIDAAISTYDKGLEQTQAAPLATDLAALYERQSKPDEAIKVYQQWVQREPKSVMANNNLAMLLVNYRTDKDSLAQALKLTEVLTSSNDPAVLDTRGWVKFKNADYQGAVSLLEQAVRAVPDSKLVRYHLGMAQLKAGNSQAARDNLQTVLKDGQPFSGSDDAQQALTQLQKTG